jgi:DNA repair photolyase
MANSSDPYLSLEKDLKLTQKTLKILKNYSLKIMIVTKSSLVLRDLEIIKNFKKIVISISLTTLDEKLAKKLEPFASLVCERLKAIEVLSKNIPVVCRLDPLIYPLTTKKIKETIKELKLRGAKQIITSTYKAKPDNLKRMVKAFGEFKKLWERLYFKEGERYGNYFYLPKDLRKKLIEEVRGYTLKEKMEFSSCREGLKNLNTKNCDGSFFF